MKKYKLREKIIHIYGVYPPESFSYDDLIRLRAMLVKYGKPKRSYLLSNKSSAKDAPIFAPPPFNTFTVEEEES